MWLHSRVYSMVDSWGRKCGCILGYILWWIQGWKVWLYSRVNSMVDSRVYSMVDSGLRKGRCIPGYILWWILRVEDVVLNDSKHTAVTLSKNMQGV